MEGGVGEISLRQNRREAPPPYYQRVGRQRKNRVIFKVNSKSMKEKIKKIYKNIIKLFLKGKGCVKENYRQTEEELIKHLREQLAFLKNSCDAYDNGNKEEAKRIASTIRTLVHDTGRSKSLLSQLGMKGKLKFYDSSFEEKPKEGGIRIGTYAALVVVSSHGYFPSLDDAPGKNLVNFSDYWDKVIFIDQENNTFIRKDVVLYLANKDGGSHVDPSLDEKYAKLSRQNSIGWKAGVEDKSSEMTGVELAAMRQIGHEILKTLIPNYSKKIERETSFMVAGGGIFLMRNKKSKN